MVNQSDPDSCAVYREEQGEALTAETGRSAIEPRNQVSGMPMLLSEAEGKTEHDANHKPCSDPARSKTLNTPGSFLHGSWEVSSVSGARVPDGTCKVKSRNPVAHADEKSDTPVVPKKPLNKGDEPAEMVEERAVAKGNANKAPAPRTQRRDTRASPGLDGVREVARTLLRVTYPRREPYAVILHVRICAAGGGGLRPYRNPTSSIP